MNKLITWFLNHRKGIRIALQTLANIVADVIIQLTKDVEQFMKPETLYLMSDPEFDEDVREGLITSISEREARN